MENYLSPKFKYLPQIRFTKRAKYRILHQESGKIVNPLLLQFRLVLIDGNNFKIEFREVLLLLHLVKQP